MLADAAPARRADRDRRRGHAGRRAPAARRARRAGDRRAEDDRQRPRRHRLDLRVRHGGVDRDRGDRPAAHDRRVARPRDGGRGDGPPRRLDRRAERHRGRRRRRADPRVPDRRSSAAPTCAARHARGSDFSIVVVVGGLAADPRGRLRGSRDADRRARRLRARPPRRRRRPAGRGAEAPDRLRDPRDGPRPPAARRLADGVRPRARDTLRPARGRPGAAAAPA